MNIGDRIGTATIATIAGERPAPAIPATYTLTILNWRPRSLNELMKMHHMSVHKAKRADKQLIAAEKFLQNIPDAAGRRRVSLRIVLGPRGQQNDADNVWKSLLDAMVAARLLVDDSPRWVELGDVEYERGTKATVITIADVGN